MESFNIPIDIISTAIDKFNKNNSDGETRLNLLKSTLFYISSLNKVFTKKYRFSYQPIRDLVFIIIDILKDVSPQFLDDNVFNIPNITKGDIENFITSINSFCKTTGKTRNDSTKCTIISDTVINCSEFDIFLYIYGYAMSIQKGSIFNNIQSFKFEEICRVKCEYVELVSTEQNWKILYEGSLSRTYIHNLIKEILLKLRAYDFKDEENKRIILEFLVEYSYTCRICDNNYRWIVLNDTGILRKIKESIDTALNNYSNEDKLDDIVKMINLHESLSEDQMLPNMVFNVDIYSTLFELNKMVNSDSMSEAVSEAFSTKESNVNDDSSLSSSSSSSNKSEFGHKKESSSIFFVILLFIGIIIIIIIIYFAFSKNTSYFNNSNSKIINK